MAIKVFNTYRIKRSASQQEMMLKLTHPSVKVFNQYKDILMISAIIGFNQKRFVPIEKAAQDGVLMQFFSERDYDIIELIAYSHKKEQAILKSEEKYEIFSGYANGGFPILIEKLGLNDFDMEEMLTEEQGRILQKKYYSLLLAGEFEFTSKDVSDDDLFI